MREQVRVTTLAATTALAQRVAKLLPSAPCYVLLSGDLGAGKTTFTKALLRSLGVTAVVTSPTFTLLNQYWAGPDKINHVDAYRLPAGAAVDWLEEEFGDGINVIEWWENLALDLRASVVLKITITILDSTTRQFVLESSNDATFSWHE